MATATPLHHRSTGSTLSLPIEGMDCGSCVAHVEKAIGKLPDISKVSVNLATKRADISFKGTPDIGSVVTAIEKAGYSVPDSTVDLRVEGMTCASCVAHVERALRAVPGVRAATVNLAAQRASIRYLGGTASVADLAAAIRAAGYQAHEVEGGDAAADREREANEREVGGLRRSLLLAIVLTLPVFLLEMGVHFVPPIRDFVANTLGTQTSWLLQFALTTAVLFGPGQIFFRKGLPALLRGTPDMNALVMIGTSAAWGYSVVATFAPQILPAGTANVYFEAAAVIVTLILLGRWLEAKAKGRTSDAIKRLVGLQPKTAHVERDGRTVEIAISEVLPGDIVQVRPGERIPVDGEVLDGSSYVDESMITGEPVPVVKESGAEITGGTINKTGTFTFRATRVGADMVLAQIIRMVEQAQGSKLPIQAMVDKVTAWFVPVVIGAAGLTFLVWLIFGPTPALSFALVNAVAVLIIACPCAMGLATPTSIMVGTGRAAELGVLFRKGEALQSLRDVAIIAVDKTGTLTRGRPELTDLTPSAGFTHDEVLALIAAVEARSEHPIAQAIVAAAEARGLQMEKLSDFEAMPGFGVAAMVGGRHVAIGADRYMTKLGHDISGFTAEAARLGAEGKSPLYAAIDNRLAAVIAVADPIKETTPDAIRALHDQGLRVAMITGDNRATAEAVARQLGIDEVIPEVLPEGKVDAIHALRAGGRKIAFVGDGINDAPALAEADVGLAIGTGTDIAIESADIVLMSGDLRGVVNAIALSRATIRNIGQNLFWAFAYNAALIPVAAGVLYPVSGILLSPIFAAAAMALSSIFVVTNALRLKAFRSVLGAGAGMMDDAGTRRDETVPPPAAAA